MAADAQSTGACVRVPQPGPMKVMVMASVVVPGDSAMPLEVLEAYVARAFKDGGVLPVWVTAEPVTGEGSGARV